MMSWYTFVCAIFLSGVTAQLSNTTSCIGDSVVYTCTVESTSHIWNVGTLPERTISSAGTLNAPVDISSGFVLQLVARDVARGNIITSTLSVTASAELNGTRIMCRDGVLTMEQGGEVQEATAMVLALPSAPDLTVIATGLQTLVFNITPPSISRQCVRNYIITPTASDGSILPDITVIDTESTQLGYNLCQNSYNFTVVAGTLGGPGERSAVVNPSPGDSLIPCLVITNDSFVVTIMGSIPMIPNYFTDSTKLISRSSLENDSCEVDIDQTSETLSCGFTGHTVTYCLQFTMDDEFIRTMETTTSFPSLFESPLVVSASTSDSITIMVDVYDQVTCSDKNGLSITATATEDGTMISMEDANFEDTEITIFELPPGDYICSVQIIDSNETVLDFLMIQCGNRVTSTNPPVTNPASIAPIIGGVVGGIAVIILVVIVVVIILVIKMSKGKGDEEKTTELKPRESYQPVADDHPTSGTAHAAVFADDSNPGLPGMYADPKSIAHETAGPTGDEYAMVAKSSKKKKKVNEPAIGHETAGPTGDEYALVTKPPKTDNEMTDGAGDMYSVPDKSKKQKNAGMVYADLNLSQKSRPPPPAAPRGIGSVYPSDNEPVLYSTVQ